MNNPNTSDIPFVDRLGRHLQNAAIERSAAPKRNRSPVPAMALAGALAILAVALVILWPQAESAQAFTITETNGIVRVEVSTLVTDPDAATAQLQDAGLNATLQAVPVPENLVGYVVSLGLADGVEVEIARDSNGVTAFEVAGTGSFVVQYGRRTTDGETYVATQSSLYCAAWRDQRVGDILTEIESSIEVLRWQMVDASTLQLTELGEPTANAFVQDVIPISARESIIIMSDEANSFPTTGEC